MEGRGRQALSPPHSLLDGLGSTMGRSGVEGRGRQALFPPHSLLDGLGSTMDSSNQRLVESQRVDSRGRRAIDNLERM